MKSIQLVSANDKERLKKYFFDYLVELSRFDPTVIFDEQGIPIYNWYDRYWEERGRYPFLLNIDNRFAGLAFVRESEPQHYEINLLKNLLTAVRQQTEITKRGL